MSGHEVYIFYDAQGNALRANSLAEVTRSNS